MSCEPAVQAHCTAAPLAMEMNHAEHRKRQSEVLEQTLTILQGDRRVLGIVMAGSYARGQHDAFSDLDVGCYLRDTDRTGRQELYDRVAEIAPLLCQLLVYDLHALYLFENGVRLDLDFYRPSDIPNASEGNGAKLAICHSAQYGPQFAPWSKTQV